MAAQFTELQGKVADVKDKWGRVLLSANERARCNICNQRKHTTVNGVCLGCQQSDKRRV